MGTAERARLQLTPPHLITDVTSGAARTGQAIHSFQLTNQIRN